MCMVNISNIQYGYEMPRMSTGNNMDFLKHKFLSKIVAVKLIWNHVYVLSSEKEHIAYCIGICSLYIYKHMVLYR